MVRNVVRGRTTLLTLVAGMTLAAPLAQGYFAGGGRDAAAGDDCLIGYESVEPGDVMLDGRKQVVTCTDCDPACDFDGVTIPNGSCTMVTGVCINQSGVPGCAPPSVLDEASAKGRVKGVRGAAGEVVIDMSQLLQGSACGAFVDMVVPLRPTASGLRDGMAKLKLKALVRTPPRKDTDRLFYICQPRPEGELCPLP